jgi:hypothetical protein
MRQLILKTFHLLAELQSLRMDPRASGGVHITRGIS